MRPIKQYQIKITIPVAVFNKKELDAKDILKRLVGEDNQISYLIQGEVMLDEDYVTVAMLMKTHTILLMLRLQEERKSKKNK